MASKGTDSGLLRSMDIRTALRSHAGRSKLEESTNFWLELGTCCPQQIQRLVDNDACSSVRSYIPSRWNSFRSPQTISLRGLSFETLATSKRRDQGEATPLL